MLCITVAKELRLKGIKSCWESPWGSPGIARQGKASETSGFWKLAFDSCQNNQELEIE